MSKRGIKGGAQHSVTRLSLTVKSLRLYSFKLFFEDYQIIPMMLFYICNTLYE